MTNRTFRIALAGLAAAALLALSGCSSIESPKLTVEDVTLSGLTAGGVELEFGVRVENPNDFAAQASGLEYTLEVNGIEVMDGRQDEPMSVPAHGSTEVRVPVTLTWGGATKALEDILDGGEQRWRLRGRVTVRSGIAQKTFPFSESGTFTTGGSTERGETGDL